MPIAFRKPKTGTAFLLALSSAVFTLLLMLFGVLGDQESYLFDKRCQWQNIRNPGDDVFLLLVDEGMLKNDPLEFGPFPWSRDIWAAIQRDFVVPIEPRSIVYDVVFDIPDNRSQNSDEQFANVIEEHGNTFLAMQFLNLSPQAPSEEELDAYDPEWAPPSPNFIRRFALTKENVKHSGFQHGSSMLRPLQAFERVSRGIGNTNTPPDSDRITRRFPLVIKYHGEYFPSLPLTVVCNYLDADIKKIKITEDYVIIPNESNSGIRIPIDSNGNLLLQYYGPELKVFPSLSLARFLQAFLEEDGSLYRRARPDRMKDKIVLIGSIASSTHDLRGVTVNDLYPLVGNIATAICNILHEDFWVETDWKFNGFLFLLLALLLAEFMQISRRLFRPLLMRLSLGVFGLGIQLLLYLVPTMILAVLYGWVAFHMMDQYNWIIPMFYGLLCLGLTYILMTLHNFVNEERNKHWYEQTWGRYMSPEMINQLRDNPEKLQIGGVERKMTLLFSDIKGFTPLSEKLSPRELIQRLNEYFEAMVQVVDENKGMLDKFMGDALMVHFGSPHTGIDDALRAVRAGVTMQERAKDLFAEWEQEGCDRLQIRIGINTGTAVVGNIGSLRRQEYTAMGDTVNTAQRLEANCPPGGVLISRATYEEVKEAVNATPLEPIMLKGKEKPQEVFLVHGLKVL